MPQRLALFRRSQSYDGHFPTPIEGTKNSVFSAFGSSSRPRPRLLPLWPRAGLPAMLPPPGGVVCSVLHAFVIIEGPGGRSEDVTCTRTPGGLQWLHAQKLSEAFKCSISETFPVPSQRLPTKSGAAITLARPCQSPTIVTVPSPSLAVPFLPAAEHAGL